MMPLWTALLCPRCEGALPTSDERRVFVCRPCGARSCVSPSGALRELPLRVLRPVGNLPPEGAVVLVPVWSIRPRSELAGAAGSRLPALIFVPAVGLGRVPLLLQLARNLSRALSGVEVLPSSGDLVAEPAQLSPEDARRLAELVALRQVEGWPLADEAETAEIPLGATELVDWPCLCRGSELVDLIGGLAAPAALIKDLGLRDQRPAVQQALERTSLATGRPGIPDLEPGPGG